MKKHNILLFFAFLFALSNSVSAQILRWDSLNQTHTIYKTEYYEFKYAKGYSRDWTYVVVDPVPGEDDLHMFTLKTNSVPPRTISLPPDTIYIPCENEDAELEFGFTDNKIPSKGIGKKTERAIFFREFGQTEIVKYCESVNIIYDGINPEDVQIIYESIDNGYALQVKRIGEPKTINFTYLCQSFIVSNPESTSMTFDPNLRFEQIIWTPKENNLWEVRIGATERKCRSKALDAIRIKRSAEYEKNIPRNKSTVKKP